VFNPKHIKKGLKTKRLIWNSLPDKPFLLGRALKTANLLLPSAKISLDVQEHTSFGFCTWTSQLYRFERPISLNEFNGELPT
jgi:hypothetical protein